jgi:hypothetical protein
MNYGTNPANITMADVIENPDKPWSWITRIATWRHSRRRRWRQLFYKIKIGHICIRVLSQLYAVYNSVNIPACNGPAINFIKTLVAVQYALSNNPTSQWKM